MNFVCMFVCLGRGLSETVNIFFLYLLKSIYLFLRVLKLSRLAENCLRLNEKLQKCRFAAISSSSIVFLCTVQIKVAFFT